MNIKQIRYFIAVVELGSLSSAAKSQCVTVQAVSKAVADLEREVEHDLFVRESRGVRATVFGRAFYQKALPISKAFAELESFAEEFQENQQYREKKLRLALVSPPFHKNEIARANIAAFFKKALGFDVTVDLCYGEEDALRLREGGLDGLLTIGEFNRPDFDCVVLGTISPSVIMREDHPLAAKEAVDLEELKKYPIGMSPMFETFNEAIMTAYKDSNLNFQFRMKSTQEAGDHYFGEEQGVVFGAGIPALGPLYPGTIMKFMCSRDAIPIPICLVGLKGQKSVAYSAFEKWLLNSRSILEVLGAREG